MTFWISQGTVATVYRRGGQMSIANDVKFPQDLTCQKSLKSVNFWQSYPRRKRWAFLGNSIDIEVNEWVVCVFNTDVGAWCSSATVLLVSHWRSVHLQLQCCCCCWWWWWLSWWWWWRCASVVRLSVHWHSPSAVRSAVCVSACQMINVGRATIDSIMQRVLKLKHPQQFTAVTLKTAELSVLLAVGLLVILVG